MHIPLKVVGISFLQCSQKVALGLIIAAIASKIVSRVVWLNIERDNLAAAAKCIKLLGFT